MKHVKTNRKVLSIFLIILFLLSTLSLNTAAAATFLKNADISKLENINGIVDRYNQNNQNIIKFNSTIISQSCGFKISHIFFHPFPLLN